MNCRSCNDALTALLDNELTADEQKTVRSHLSVCPECQKEYDSLLWAFDLTEKIDTMDLNPAIWTRIQSELTAAESGFGSYLKTLFLPPWRPVAAFVGMVLVVSVLFVSFPRTSIDPALEEEFTQFMQQREEISRENRRILFEPRLDRNRREGNPFVRPVSYERTNPFQE